MKTLGGFMFVRNGMRYDYCFRESIRALCAHCDEVVVLCIMTEDTTMQELERLDHELENLTALYLPDAMWNEVRGKEKLAYFQNLAAQVLETDYIYLQQADEVTTDESWPYIREAMQQGADGYIVSRINLWQSCDLMLNVSQNRKPCSTEVLRLAKRGHQTYGDGESIATDEAYMDYMTKIHIFHYGFVRKKEVHADKIRQMQRDIFLTNPDSKLEGMADFDPTRWFGPEDLAPIVHRHPAVMREWVRTRP